MKDQLYYGCAYYPELWDVTELDSDIIHMKKLGINVVRMGEFAWSFIEPEEGRLRGEYFRKIIEVLSDNGIETIMCTPTAAPPVWMTFQHPERCFKTQAGEILSHGARQHCCTSQEYFIARSRMVVEEIAKKLSGQKGLIGWQIDNEFKCHVAECYCDSCLNQWHQWLEVKYGTVEKMNAAWGTDVWSERYLSFEQVPQPVKTPFLHHASLTQAYQRFSREKITWYCDMQAEILRRYSDLPITHNTGAYFSVDAPALFEHLDFASFDDYAEAEHYQVMFRSYDYFRMLKPGKPFWVMETSPNHNGSLMGTAKPHPKGYLKAEVASAYISGAQGFSYWLFRQQRTGCELAHGSILSAWGKPTCGYQEVADAARVKAQIEPFLLQSRAGISQIALMYSDLARITLETEPLGYDHYWDLIQKVYESEIPDHASVDLIHETTDLNGYDVLYTPFMASFTDEFLEKAVQYVNQGGIWIAGPMCNYRTTEHGVPTDAGWGKLAAFAGVEVQYMMDFDSAQITGEAMGMEFPLTMLGTTFEAAKAISRGSINSPELEGQVFLTETQLDYGLLVLLGAHPAQTEGSLFMKKLIAHYLELRTGMPGYGAEKRIKIVRRLCEDGSVSLFAVDMEGKGGSLSISSPFVVLLSENCSGSRQAGTILLNPYETVIVKLA